MRELDGGKFLTQEEAEAEMDSWAAVFRPNRLTDSTIYSQS